MAPKALYEVPGTEPIQFLLILLCLCRICPKTTGSKFHKRLAQYVLHWQAVDEREASLTHFVQEWHEFDSMHTVSRKMLITFYVSKPTRMHNPKGVLRVTYIISRPGQVLPIMSHRLQSIFLSPIEISIYAWPIS